MREVSSLEALKLLAENFTVSSNNVYYRIRKNRLQQSDSPNEGDFEDSNTTISEFLNSDTYKVEALYF